MAAHHDPQAATARRGGVAPPRTALTRSWSAPPSTPRATPAPPTAWSQVADGARRVAGAAPRRRARAPPSRRRLARLPVRTPCAPCRGAGPTRLPRRQGQPPCPRPWINAQAHRLLVGGGGLGNPPRATARGEAAGLQGSAVLCARARAGRNTRAAAQRAGRRTQARTNSPTPARLLRDERGARPLAKAGAARRCHGLRRRSAPGAIMLPSTRACTAWPPLCNHARPLPAALLDRRRHPAETVMRAGQRVRRHGQIEQETALQPVSPDVHVRLRRRLASPCASRIAQPHCQTAVSPTCSRSR